MDMYQRLAVAENPNVMTSYKLFLDPLDLSTCEEGSTRAVRRWHLGLCFERMESVYGVGTGVLTVQR